MKNLKQFLNEVRELQEASEIQFNELEKSDQKFIKKTEKLLNGFVRGVKVSQIWDGIHGRIVDFDIDSPFGGSNRHRIFLPGLQKIAKLKMRWIEFGSDSITIGF